MKKESCKLSEQIRREINASELSRYAICKRIGLGQACMSRFMAGKVGLTIKNIDAIGQLLGLSIVKNEEQKE